MITRKEMFSDLSSKAYDVSKLANAIVHDYVGINEDYRLNEFDIEDVEGLLFKLKSLVHNLEYIDNYYEDILMDHKELESLKKNPIKYFNKRI